MRAPALPLVLLLTSLWMAPACSTPDTRTSAEAAPDTQTPPAAAAGPTTLERYRRAAGLTGRELPVRLRGTGVGVSDNAEGNRRIVIQAEHPGRYRQFDGPMSSDSQLRLTVFLVNGPNAWRVGSALLAGRGQSTNLEERRAAEAAAARQNHLNTLAGVMPLWLANDPAVTVVDIGAMPDGPFKGSPTVAVKFGNAEPTHVVFDADTGLPSVAVVPFLREIRSTGGTYTIRYEDYRDVDGIKLPFRLVREGAERTRTRWMFRTWDVNPTFAPGLFDKTTTAR